MRISDWSSDVCSSDLIAGLWARRHRAHLDEAEAEAEHGGHRARILVEAGGKAERVAERQAPERRGEKGIVVDGAVRSEPALQGPEGQAMRALRIEPPQQRAGERKGVQVRLTERSEERRGGKEGVRKCR